jgi:hypothetical protein
MTGDYGTFKVVHAERWHASFVSVNLRKQDLEEVPKGKTPYTAIMEGLECGCSYAIVVDEIPVAIMGSSGVGDYSVIWMVGTPNIRKIRRELVTQGRKFAERLIGRYTYGGNMVYIKNYNAIRWLKRMGAEFGEPVLVDSKKFIPFNIIK